MTVLAVDLGGTHMRCAAVDERGAISGREEEATPHDGTGVSALTELVKAVGNVAVATSAVIGLPGRVDYRHGRLEHAPNLPPGWEGALDEKSLSDAIGLPVALANDADLAAVGEAYYGAGRAYSDVAYMTVSTGIGAGVVLGGLLVHGRRSLAEIGHTVIDMRADPPATLEELGSGTSLGRAAKAAGLGALGKDVLDARAAGDPAAIEIWDGLTRAVGIGAVNMAWEFTPEVIVVGGGLGLIGDALLAPVRAALSELGPPGLDPMIKVMPAALGDDAGLTGAAAWARAFVPEHAGR